MTSKISPIKISYIILKNPLIHRLKSPILKSVSEFKQKCKSYKVHIISRFKRLLEFFFHTFHISHLISHIVYLIYPQALFYPHPLPYIFFILTLYYWCFLLNTDASFLYIYVYIRMVLMKVTWSLIVTPPQTPSNN